MTRASSTAWLRVQTRMAIYHRDGFRCVYCAFPVSSKSATIDHLTPTSRGGKHLPRNLVTACRRCNFSRQDRPLARFTPRARAVRSHARRALDRHMGRVLAQCFGRRIRP
jgi:5-methylcytosine-specific restriction endonuclease McrA